MDFLEKKIVKMEKIIGIYCLNKFCIFIERELLMCGMIYFNNND